MKVLIVGAGPTGLTTAVELARRGVIPTVIEKRPTPSPFSRAVGILARSMELLAPSGVAAALKDEAIRFEGVMFHRGTRRLNRLPLNFSPGTELWGLAQDRTEHHLAAALRRHGGDVSYGTALEGLEQDQGGVTVRFGGREGRFDHVIGADGTRSPTREALGLAFPGIDLPQQWSIADVTSASWPHRRWFTGYQLDRGDVVVVAPLEETRFRVIASRPEALPALPVPMEVDHLHRAGAFTISVRQVEKYGVGRVFLAGDAAHCHSPVGGRGMNLGIADGAELAKRMVQGTLGGYQAARHPEGAHAIRLSERGRRAMQSTNPVTRAAVYSVLWLTGHVPALGRAALNQLVNG